MGLFLGLLPPIFDFVIFQNRSAFYGYYFVWDFNSLPYTGYKPEFNFPAGETLAIWLSIFFCAAYTFAVSKNVARAIVALAVAYAVFIFMGSLLPMIVARLSGVTVASVSEARGVDPQTLRALALRLAFYQGILAFITYLFLRPALLHHLLRRALHILPFVMLVVLGGAAVNANPVSLAQSTLLIAIYGFVALAQNDYFDAQDASIKRNVERFDVQILNALYLMTLIPVFMAGNRAAIAGLIIFVCGILYNYPLYRARNYFPANLKIEGIWGVMAFMAGTLLDVQASSRSGVLIMAFLVFGGWSTVAVLKDLKDAEEDYRDGVQTLFTIFMRRGKTVVQVWSATRIVLSSLVMIPVLIALVLLNFRALLLVGVTTALIGTFWLNNHKRAFQIQLIILGLMIGFWQLAFYLEWITLLH